MFIQWDVPKYLQNYPALTVLLWNLNPRPDISLTEVVHTAPIETLAHAVLNLGTHVCGLCNTLPQALATLSGLDNTYI